MSGHWRSVHDLLGCGRSGDSAGIAFRGRMNALIAARSLWQVRFHRLVETHVTVRAPLSLPATENDAIRDNQWFRAARTRYLNKPYKEPNQSEFPGPGRQGRDVDPLTGCEVVRPATYTGTKGQRHRTNDCRNQEQISSSALYVFANCHVSSWLRRIAHLLINTHAAMGATRCGQSLRSPIQRDIAQGDRAPRARYPAHWHKKHHQDGNHQEQAQNAQEETRFCVYPAHQRGGYQRNSYAVDARRTLLQIFADGHRWAVYRRGCPEAIA